MRCKRVARWGLGLAVAATMAAGQAYGQAPGQVAGQVKVTLQPRYPPGTKLLYAISIHSSIGSKATMDTTAEAEMSVQPGTAPGSFEAAMRFTKFSTMVKTDDANTLADLTKQAAATDHAAVSMAAARFQVGTGAFQVLFRQAGADYDQPVEMLEELARTDELPSGPTAVGEHWTRQRTRAIPTMNVSVPLTLDCSLTGMGQAEGRPTAAITVHSQGNATLPPGALPGSDQLAAQGLVPEATIVFDTTSHSQFRVADAVLLETTSQTHNQMNLKLVGPSPQAGNSVTDIDSTATVKLESSSGG
ncbi:MAG: hypothetical protein ACRD1L_09005 [Terriglobales bacterium]